MRQGLLLRGACVIVAAMALSAGASASAYEGRPVADPGAIVGEVKFAGEVPEREKIVVDMDPEICGTEHLSEALIVSKASKGIQNVVVSLVEVKRGRRWDRPKGGTEFLQKGCRFIPHVVLAPQHGTVYIINNDPLTHNIRTFSVENPEINQVQPPTMRKISATFEVPETFRARCDVHTKMMTAWFVVTDSPYYVLTDAEGKFKLDDIPAGTYKLQVWHETLGVQTREVTVKAKGETRVAFELKGE